MIDAQRSASGNDVGSLLDVRKPVDERLAWTETVLITLVSLLLCAWANPENPFYVNEGFPWPALASMLCGLRYGFAHGFSSSLFIITALGAAINRGWWISDIFPFTYALGTVGFSMLCGEFRDIWERRLQRLQGANAYRAQRLEEFTRNYHLLRLSHDQLEQQLAGSGNSLREALTRLHHELVTGQGWQTQNAQSVVNLLSDIGSLHKALLLDEKGLMLAQTGDMAVPANSDPLIKRCMKEKRSIAVTMDGNGLSAQQNSCLLAAVPLLDANGTLHAVLAIESLPFFALTDERMRLLSIVAAHVCDVLFHHNQLDVQRPMQRELGRALADVEQFGVEACVVLLSAPTNVANQQLLAQWRQQIRALDIWQQKDHDEKYYVAVLLTMTDIASARHWLARLPKNGDVQIDLLALDSAVAARVLLWGKAA